MMGKKKRGIKQTPKKGQNSGDSRQFWKKRIGISPLLDNKGIAALFLFLFSFGVFAFSLNSGFVWDDIILIQRSTSLKASNISYKNFLIPWLGKDYKGKHYRPLMRASWIADQEIWSGSPFGFHLSNVIFNSVSTVLFYLMAVLILGEFRVERKKSIAFLSSLFFALIPLHVESVSFISARGDLLCSMFFFSAFIFNILSYRKLWFFALSILCFYLSLLSKEVAVAFPLVAIGYDIISGRFRSRGSMLRYGFYGLLILVYLYFRRETLELISRFLRDDLWRVSGDFFFSYLFYLGKLVFPFNLNPFITSEQPGIYYFIFSVLVITSLCVLGYISIKKRKEFTAFCIYWIFATLGPVSLVAMFGFATTQLAERFLYIPTAGFCMLIGYLFFEMAKKLKSENLGWVLGLLLCVLYLFFTIRGQEIWVNDESLWEYASKKSPNYAITYVNYGNALATAGKTDEAIREFLLAFKPGVKSGKKQRIYAAFDLGLIYFDKKEYELSERWLNKALSYKPNFSKPYYVLGLIYTTKAKNENEPSYYGKAEAYLNRATKLNRRYGAAHIALADLYLELGEMEKAREEAKKALGSGLKEPFASQARRIINITGN